MHLPTFSWKAHRAAQLMRHGEVIAYPTEAVWGLGCDPLNEQAVRKVLGLKTRPMAKGLILISGQREHFLELLAPYNEAKREAFFAAGEKSPVTCLVEDRRDIVPAWIKGDHRTVALRYTRHPICQLLTNAFGGLIVSTSANPAGKPEAKRLFEAKNYFGNRLSMYLQAPLGNSLEVSKIIDLESGDVLRG